MAMPETWLKLMAGKKILEGGIEGANKAFEGFSLQARADKVRKKKQANNITRQIKKATRTKSQKYKPVA